jgi:hypothetical protein
MRATFQVLTNRGCELIVISRNLFILLPFSSFGLHKENGKYGGRIQHHSYTLTLSSWSSFDWE